MREIEQWLDARYLGNTVWEWGTVATLAAALFAVLLLVRRLIRVRYARYAATPETELMEVPLKIASRTATLFLLIAAIYGAMQLVEVPRLHRLMLTVFTIACFWQLGLYATTAVLTSIERRQRSALAADRATAGTLGVIGFIARATIWSFVLLLTLDNLGIEIKPLLAGLGIGGIAVALAVQNVLGDLFASLSITLDRPFVVGDALAVDDFNGTVEYIGVKSTRLRSINGEQIIMPNASLLASRVRNFARMTERRVVYTISVDQHTPRELLQKIPGQIRELIQSHPDVRFDRSHFAKIGATSFDFEAVYFVLTPDYGRHMDILQDINLRLMETFQRQGIAFAYPTQRLFMEAAKPVESQLVTGDGNRTAS
jgi:small-conductance mechanosensitive channel